MDTITKLGIIFASFVTYLFFFHFVSSWFSAKVFPQFNVLSLEKKIQWKFRMVSTCYTLVTGIVYLYIFLFDQALTAGSVWDDLPLLNVIIAISTGYIISVSLILIFYWRAIGNTISVILFWVLLYIYYLMLMGRVPAYMVGFRLLRLLDAPFVNQQYFFDILEYSKFSEAFVINKIFMTVMFFLLQIAMMPVFYYSVYCVYGTGNDAKLGFLVQWSWISSFVVADIINIIWMIKMITWK